MAKPRHPHNRSWTNVQLPNGPAQAIGGSIPRNVTRLLRKWSRSKAVAALSGLLLDPEFQSSCVRLEALVHASLATSAGGKSRISPNQLSATFNLLSQTQFGYAEDPAEDVMVSNVIFQGDNYRVPTGLWESAGFLLQRTLDVVDSMPNEQGFNELRKSIGAILALSDRICERAGLKRNQLGSESPLLEFPPIGHQRLERLTELTLFTSRDLTELGVTLTQLSPFILNSANYRGLLLSELGQSPLEGRPLTAHGVNVRFALPTAVSVAIRRLVIDGSHGTPNQPSYELALSRSYRALFSRTPVLGAGKMSRLAFFRIGTVHVAEARLKDDTGTSVQLIFIVDGLARYSEFGWAGVSTVDSRAVEYVVARIRDATEGASNGASLIVHCGWGRGFAFALPEIRRTGWDVRHISAADLVTLSWCGEVNPLTIPRLLEAEAKLESAGVKLQNINGLLNLYAWAKFNDFHLVPHSDLPENLSTADGTILLVIEQNALRRLRHETLVDWDEHSVELPDGESVVVRRHTSSAMFAEDRGRPLYVSSDDAAHRQLNAVYVARSFRLWCAAVGSPDHDLDLHYRIWDAAVHWMIRVAPLIDHKCGSAIPRDVIWTINLGDFRPREQPPTPAEIQLAPSFLETEVHSESAQITTVLKAEFAPAFSDPHNTAEAAIVEKLIEGCFKIADMEKAFHAEKPALVNAVVPNPWARHIHMFTASTYRDYVRKRIPREVRLINQMDDAIARIGLGWRAHERAAGARIEGITECTSFLNALADDVFNELKASLAQLDRREVIEEMLLNHEAAEIDRDQWDRTSRAVLALRNSEDSEEEALAVISERQARLNGACLASRLAVEIALCECPLQGGQSPGNWDIDRIIVQTTLLYRLGNESDAIKWRALAPIILISPAGDIQFSTAFGDTVVEPFGRMFHSRRIRHQTTLYEKHFEAPPDSREPISSVLDERFMSAWETEFGFSVDELIELLDALDPLGLARDSAVFTIDGKTLHDALAQVAGDQCAASFLSRFSLVHRDRWDRTPAGFDAKDWYPWRFRRRLSLLSRPLVRLNHSDNPCYVVAPGLIRAGIHNLVVRAFDGELPSESFGSVEMKRWIGTRSSEKGHEFNDSVASVLREDNWQVLSNLELPSALNRKLDRDYGDIDVLAWKYGDQRILAVEAKDVGIARGEGEIARQLYEFRGEKFESGEPDRLLRHLERVRVLREHFPELKKNLGMPEDVESIDPWLVFSSSVPLQFVEKLSINVAPLANLRAQLTESQ